MSQAIVDLLVREGQRFFAAPPTRVPFTRQRNPDDLLNNLTDFPHAFVLACVMDRQIKAERAWLIPFSIQEKLGTFAFSALRALSLEAVTKLMKEPIPLHRFPDEMSKNFHSAVQWIADTYSGDASAIWSNKPSSAEVVYRFLQLRGVGPKIGSMAANILARDFKIPFSDYYSIDLSVDVQVKRVFIRLGLALPTDDVQAIIYRARALYPEFPGIFDFPAWEIGRTWCRPTHPQCGQCLMRLVCPSSNA